FRREFEAAYGEGGLFQLTMHPHVIGYRSRSWIIEELIRLAQSRPGVWFATHADVARWAKDNAGRVISALPEAARGTAAARNRRSTARSRPPGLVGGARRSPAEPRGGRPAVTGSGNPRRMRRAKRPGRRRSASAAE